MKPPGYRWRAAVLLGVAVAMATPPSASANDAGLSLRLIDRVAGPAVVGADGLVSFGDVSKFGPPPNTGERIHAADGGTHFVATFELQVLRRDSPLAHPARDRSSWSRIGPARRIGGVPEHRPIQQMPGDTMVRPAVATADLYVTLVGGGFHSEVRAALAGTVDWSQTRDAGILLDGHGAPVARFVRAGDVVRCQVSLYAPDDLLGPFEGSVQFSLR